MFRWLRTPHDVDVPLAAKRQCAQHPLSLPCRPQSIRHSEAEVLDGFAATTRSHVLGIFVPWAKLMCGWQKPTVLLTLRSVEYTRSLSEF